VDVSNGGHLTGLNTDFGLVTPTLNDGVITVQNPSPGATPAPEPATLVLVVLGGLCLGAYAWRRRLYFASATAGPGRVAVSSVETLAPDSCSLLKPDEVRLAFSLPERLLILDMWQRSGLPAGTGYRLDSLLSAFSPLWRTSRP